MNADASLRADVSGFDGHQHFSCLEIVPAGSDCANGVLLYYFDDKGFGYADEWYPSVAAAIGTARDVLSVSPTLWTKADPPSIP